MAKCDILRKIEQEGEMVSEMSLDIAVAILGLFLTIVTTVIAIIDIKSNIKEKKTDEFKLINKMLANGYWKVYESVLEAYYNKIRPHGLVDITDLHQTPPMLYMDNWLYNGNVIRKLSCVELKYIEPSHVDYRYKSNRQSIKTLPYPKKSFEQNLSLVCDSSLYNGRIYSPVEYHSDDGSICLYVTKRNYFDFINTCFHFSYNDTFDILNTVEPKYKSRKKNNPFDFKNRVSTVGIVTLTVLYNVVDDEKMSDNTKYFILHKRSNDVAECKSMINAIPAGMYQPSFYENDREPEPLGYTVFREFGEEMLGCKEFTELNDTKDICDLFMENNDGINERIIYLGAAINPVNLYLELLTVLPLDMNDQRNREILGGKELSKIKEALKKNEESGEIFIEEFNLRNIRHYSHMHLCAPALKQIMSIFANHYNKLSKDLFE